MTSTKEELSTRPVDEEGEKRKREHLHYHLSSTITYHTITLQELPEGLYYVTQQLIPLPLAPSKNPSSEVLYDYSTNYTQYLAVLKPAEDLFARLIVLLPFEYSIRMMHENAQDHLLSFLTIRKRKISIEFGRELIPIIDDRLHERWVIDHLPNKRGEEAAAQL